jgi:hypothetical protein
MSLARISMESQPFFDRWAAADPQYCNDFSFYVGAVCSSSWSAISDAQLGSFGSILVDPGHKPTMWFQW